MRLRVGHHHAQFLLILARFVNYYLVFWVPEAICVVVEPQGAFTCRSSTLVVLADSGPFHGLLLTILARFGVPERFLRLMIPKVCLPFRRQHSQF